jgi:hypothetical protein
MKPDAVPAAFLRDPVFELRKPDRIAIDMLHRVAHIAGAAVGADRRLRQRTSWLFCMK